MENVTGREFHAVADLFPLLRGAAFDELVADIKQNGLLEPILLDDEGRILDGRNRYRACLAAGVEPRFRTWDGQGSLTEMALSFNLRRRHLDESQRAMVAARVAKMLEKEAFKRKGRRTDLAANLQPGKRCRSSSEAAAQVNVSERLIFAASKVLRDGSEELIAAVDSGVLAVSTAAVLAGLPKPEQTQAVAGGAKEAARKARELRAADRPAAPQRPAGEFVVIYLRAPGEPATDESVAGCVFLAVASSRLVDAVAALESGGFRRRSPGA